jgi:carbon monoxide dehydrogenase subunit G
MASGAKEITIEAAPDQVWSVVRDFTGLAGWMPGIETCVADENGDRLIGMMGMEIRERCYKLDDDARVLVYGIADGVPVDKHEVTISVLAEGDGTKVVWAYEVEPDEMGDLMGGLYEQSLTALKDRVSA